MNFKPGDEVFTSINSAAGQSRKYKVLAGPEKGNSGNAMYYKLQIAGNTSAPSSWVREDHIQRGVADGSRQRIHVTDRAQLHRALDAVMDRAEVRRVKDSQALSEPEMRELYELKAARKRGPLTPEKTRKYFELNRRNEAEPAR